METPERKSQNCRSVRPKCQTVNFPSIFELKVLLVSGDVVFRPTAIADRAVLTSGHMVLRG